MQKQKLNYETPVVETLVVRFEESVLQVTSPTNEDMKEKSMTGGWVID